MPKGVSPGLMSTVLRLPSPVLSSTLSAGQIRYTLVQRARRCFSLRRDPAREIWYYQDGVYLPHGKQMLKKWYTTEMEGAGLGHKWDSKSLAEILEFLLSEMEPLSFLPFPDGISVKNGFLRWNGTLEPHSPEHSNQIQLPMLFRPEADCPKWDAFLSSLFPEDSISLAWQVLAWLMFPDIKIQKAVLLYGPGGNGKSTFVDCVQHNLLGKETVSQIPPLMLEQNRFSSYYLFGKAVNMCRDLPLQEVSDSAMFKAITGQDPIWAERKHGEQFSFQPFCKMILNTNHMPRSKDYGRAYWRRWLVVPFLQEFKGERGIAEIVEDLREEASGVLNRVLGMRGELQRLRLSDTPSTATLLEDFSSSTDPFNRWKTCLAENPSSSLPKDLLYSRYYGWMQKEGRSPLSQSQFFQRLRQEFPSYEEAHPRGKDGRKRVILGLSLLEG